jgi:hypothetical protein
LTAAAITAVCLIAGVLTVTSQDKPFVEKVLGTLTRISEDQLAGMSQLLQELDYDPVTGAPDALLLAERATFFEAPRLYLLDEWDIGLSPNAIRIYALDKTIPSPDDENRWITVNEPLEGRVADSESIAWFGNRVGVIVSRAYDPEDAEPLSASQDQTEAYLDTVTLITVEALDRLEMIMDELDQPDMEAERKAFVREPRAWLVEQDVILPASDFMITAVDVELGVGLGAVVIDRERAGLGRYKEGISINEESISLVLVQAI